MSVQLPVNLLVIDTHSNATSTSTFHSTTNNTKLSPSSFSINSSSSNFSSSPFSNSLTESVQPSIQSTLSSHVKSQSIQSNDSNFEIIIENVGDITTPMDHVSSGYHLSNSNLYASSPTSSTALSDENSPQYSNQDHHFNNFENDNLSNNSGHSHASHKSKRSSKSSRSYSEFKHLPPLDELREQYFLYLSKHEYESEGRTKILFLIKFMEPLSMKVSKSLSREMIMDKIDEFSRDLLFETNTPTSNIDIGVDTGRSMKILPYFTSLVTHLKNRTAKLFSHERLELFLKKQYECHVKGIEIPLHTDSNDKLIGIGILDEIQIIIQMFLYDMEDWFYIFQVDEEKFITKWMKTNLEKLPSPALQILLKKRELFNHAEKDYKFSAEDLTVKSIIDSDWKIINYLTREFSPDWYPTVKNRGKLMQWCTKTDFSLGNLDAKTMKMVGKLENSLEECVKALHVDDHLSFILKNVIYHQNEGINMNSSQRRYSTANLSSDFELGSLFPKRYLEMVLSSQGSFVGGEMTECLLLMKSCDNVASGEIVEKRDRSLRIPLVGSRLLQKIDNNRTRYIEFRMMNPIGIMNTSMVWDMARKKLATHNETGLKEAISRSQKKGFDSSIEKNNILKTLYDNCKQYHNIDIREVLNKDE